MGQGRGILERNYRLLHLTLQLYDGLVKTALPSLLTRKTVLKALPGVLFLSLGFAVTFFVWPTKRTSLAILLYLPLPLLTLLVGCYLVQLRERENDKFWFLKGATVLFGIWLAFVVYALSYRRFCM